MTKKLPCPFCEYDDPHMEPQLVGGMRPPYQFQVKCRMCGSMGPIGPRLEEAIRAWNNPKVRNAQNKGSKDMEKFKAHPCPGCDRMIPINWVVPFTQANLKENRDKCQVCLDFKVGPDGEPLHPEVAE